MEQQEIDLTRGARHTEIPTGKKIVAILVTLLCLAAVAIVCTGLGGIIWFEGREVDISVETSGKTYTESVSFKVENVIGMDLLLGKKEGGAAILQKQNGEEWVDVCEIRFVGSDGAAISAKYGGMFSHLAPGGALEYKLDGKLLETMESGTYRLAVYYISEEQYEDYLHGLAARIEQSLAEERSLAEQSEESAEESEDERSDAVSEPEEGSEESEETEAPESADEASEESEEPSEEPVPMPEIQALYKVFTFVSREDGVVEESETTAGAADKQEESLIGEPLQTGSDE